MNLKEQIRWKVTKQDGDILVKGKYGQIDQYKDGDINVWVTSIKVSNKVPWKPLHTYDDGADYCRKFDDLDIACGYIKAHKRRHLSPEHLQKLLASPNRKPFMKRTTTLDDTSAS